MNKSESIILNRWRLLLLQSPKAASHELISQLLQAQATLHFLQLSANETPFMGRCWCPNCNLKSLNALSFPTES